MSGEQALGDPATSSPAMRPEPISILRREWWLTPKLTPRRSGESPAKHLSAAFACSNAAKTRRLRRYDSRVFALR